MSTWRQREIEKARLRKEAAARAEEEARTKSIQKTETNFPSMIAAPKASAQSFDTSFSSLAQQWATQEKVDATLAEYRAQKAAKAARENAVHGVVLLPRRRRIVEEYEEEDEEEEAAPAPSEDDWTEVRHSKGAGRRELTTAELEQMYRDRGAPEDREEDEYNRELFEREY